MKPPKSQWYQPQGWMRFGVWVVVGILILYLLYMVVFQFVPRLRKIGNNYNVSLAARCVGERDARWSYLAFGKASGRGAHPRLADETAATAPTDGDWGVPGGGWAAGYP
ncbi:MAG: hypothetical protein QHJ73_05200 [Armatimonadota bacterium]|nr:hypothetical protein [Armatimonadota bacterium]